MAEPAGPLGVVIVTHGAAAFVGDCLESLFAGGEPGGGPPLRVVCVDMASPDGTVEAILAWARGDARPETGAWPFEALAFSPEVAVERRGPVLPRAPEAPLTIIEPGANLGFAGGVNLGLASLRLDPGIGAFWVLNPDTVVAPGTPGAFAAAAAAGPFALLGGRLLYLERPGAVQNDGGRLRLARAGVAMATMGGPATAPMPDAATLDFVSGASMVASRAFLDRAGPMDERYFLYFEEIDWALRRGDLPIRLVPEGRVYHRAGASIGSGSGIAAPSALASYFRYRNLLPFVARWRPAALATAYPAALAEVLWRHRRRAAWPALGAALRGLHGLGPPDAVAARLGAAPWREGRQRTWEEIGR